MAHINVGSWWAGMPSVPPRFQIIFWRCWKGVTWFKWPGSLGLILHSSLVLGYVEIRFWRRPVINAKVEYPGGEK